MWSGEDADSSLDAQEAFIRNGGQIHRIIAGPHSLEDIEGAVRAFESAPEIIRGSVDIVLPNEEGGSVSAYAKVISLMNRHRIHTYYACVSNSSRRRDFAVVEINDRALSMEWEHSEDFRTVDRSIITDKADASFLLKWKSLRKAAMPLGSMAETESSDTE